VTESSRVADGVPEMHKVVRENLMRGASQIKLAVGGGVSSNFDPIDVTEYTKEEIQAAVADGENWAMADNAELLALSGPRVIPIPASWVSPRKARLPICW
jgi:hypothetical protein